MIECIIQNNLQLVICQLNRRQTNKLKIFCNSEVNRNLRAIIKFIYINVLINKSVMLNHYETVFITNSVLSEIQ